MTILFRNRTGRNNLPDLRSTARYIAYTKTLDGRILKSMICPVCHISRGYVVEKEGDE